MLMISTGRGEGDSMKTVELSLKGESCTPEDQLYIKYVTSSLWILNSPTFNDEWICNGISLTVEDMILSSILILFWWSMRLSLKLKSVLTESQKESEKYLGLSQWNFLYPVTFVPVSSNVCGYVTFVHPRWRCLWDLWQLWVQEDHYFVRTM